MRSIREAGVRQQLSPRSQKDRDLGGSPPKPAEPLTHTPMAKRPGPGDAGPGRLAGQRPPPREFAGPPRGSGVTGERIVQLGFASARSANSSPL